MSGTGLTAATPFLLVNTDVRVCTIHVTDAAGDLVPADPADVFSVAVDNAAEFNAVIGTDAAGLPALVVNSLVSGGSTVYTTTVTDSAGLTSGVDFWQVTSDKTAKNIVVDLVDSVATQQPAPTLAPAVA